MREIEKIEHIVCDMCKSDSQKVEMSGNHSVPTFGEYILYVEGTEPECHVDLCHRCYFKLADAIPFLDRLLNSSIVLVYVAALRR